VYGYRFLCLENKILKPELEWRFAPEEWFPSAAEQAVTQLQNGVKTQQFSGSGGSTHEAEYWPLELELRRVSEREIWLLVAAKSFRYKMVRCIASAVGQCLSGTLSEGDLKKLLNNSEQTIKPAPAAGCYLLNVNYEQRDKKFIIQKAWQRVKDFRAAGNCQQALFER
jgi:tRNA U38,U39,U40 pseudouridine synthase TruA